MCASKCNSLHRETHHTKHPTILIFVWDDLSICSTFSNTVWLFNVRKLNDHHLLTNIQLEKSHPIWPNNQIIYKQQSNWICHVRRGLDSHKSQTKSADIPNLRVVAGTWDLRS